MTFVIFISLNYTMKVTKEELSQTAVLASILSKSSKKYKNQGEIEKYLFKLYGANFDVNVQKIGDLYDLEFKFVFSHEEILKDFINSYFKYIGEETSKEAGEIVVVTKDAIGISCSDNIYYVTKLKPFGKKTMMVRDYLNGIKKEDLLNKKVK